jgi:hypothetical protein
MGVVMLLVLPLVVRVVMLFAMSFVVSLMMLLVISFLMRFMSLVGPAVPRGCLVTEGECAERRSQRCDHQYQNETCCAHEIPLANGQAGGGPVPPLQPNLSIGYSRTFCW